MSGNTNTGTVYKRILVIFILFFAVVVSIGGSISGLAKARREEKGAYKYYTSIPIGKGDTLWSIAVENITPEYAGIEEYIQEIRSLNHLSLALRPRIICIHQAKPTVSHSLHTV